MITKEDIIFIKEVNKFYIDSFIMNRYNIDPIHDLHLYYLPLFKFKSINNNDLSVYTKNIQFVKQLYKG